MYKFPSWSWADAASPDKRVSYFPPGKQYLVTRGVPCRKRIKSDDFAGKDGEDQLVRDMLRETGKELGGDDDGWLKAGGDGAELSKSAEMRMDDVRSVDELGEISDQQEEEEIPDMDDEDDDEAIIRDTKSGAGSEG